jgi:RNAse (barnase) inhibitor barstar
MQWVFMTQNEFKDGTKKLSEAFPNQFSKTRQEIIWKYVKDLDASWWNKIVERVVVTHNVRFDFAESANNEKRYRASLRLVDDVVAAADRLKKELEHRQGLTNAIQEMGAENLMDAVLKKRGEGKT